MDIAYLEMIVESFVANERKDRLLGFLRSRKRYADFLDELLHDARHINPEVIEVLRGADRLLVGVVARMRALGVGGHAYLVGNAGRYSDGDVDDFEKLLEACVGSMTDSLVYSWTSDVAYYEGHEGFSYLYRKHRDRSRAGN